MGEIRDDDEDALTTWESMVDFASRYERYHDLAAKMIAGGPPPSGRPALLDSALIIDTDVGGDPDDAIALKFARKVNYKGFMWWLGKQLADLVHRADHRTLPDRMGRRLASRRRAE